MNAEPHFTFTDDPDHPGWKRWELRDPTRFNAFLGPILTRVEDGKALVRMVPAREHSNLRDSTHGGALLGFMDVALFAAARSFGVLGAGSAPILASRSFTSGMASTTSSSLFSRSMTGRGVPVGANTYRGRIGERGLAFLRNLLAEIPRDDLIVLAMVNPGAEVLADGHIHIYAPLRGKAIAGARDILDGGQHAIGIAAVISRREQSFCGIGADHERSAGE